MKEQKRFDKAREQQEYRRMFQQNADREISNEMAYKKRFEDFNKDLQRKNQEFGG